jgi:NAD(P)-dependent dehydrogenase (short-subunit alcohol dehydrogenase family)
VSLEGKRTLVTGAGSGIGRAIALAFAREGAVVACNDLDADRVREVVAAIKAEGGHAVACPGDVSREEGVERVVRAALGAYGAIDVLHSNAGVCPQGSVMTDPEEVVLRTLAVNTRALFLFLREVAPVMSAAGGGRVIVTVSNCADAPRVGLGTYCVSKAAVMHLVRTAALELARHKIWVNAICPGSTDTELQRRNQEAMDTRDKIVRGAPELFRAGIPVGRLGDVRDQADLAVFLASERASFVTGQAFYMDGGQWLR